MAKGPSTSVSNAKLDHLIKLADTYLIKVENGEWRVPKGTYDAIKKSVEHVKIEMVKQGRQRRRTMDISYVQDPECREMVARQNTQNIIQMAYDGE